jgi:hypothetical protein
MSRARRSHRSTEDAEQVGSEHEGVREKTCSTCGRRFAWRKKWARAWPNVRTCSAACRRALNDDDRALEEALRALVAQGNAPVDPETVLAPFTVHEGASLTRRMHDAARRLAHAGALELVMHGRVVSPHDVKRPFLVQRSRRA